MPVYKDKAKNTWYAQFYYEDWRGKRIKKMKRGFQTKREAEDYIVKFKMRESKNLSMLFDDFIEIYYKDQENRIKKNTMITMKYVIETKIRPYFKDKKINEIKVSDIISWHNEMLAFRYENGKPYSQKYLNQMHSRLSTIFNHACRFYELKDNPARKAGNMGRSRGEEMLFWTKAEYLKFAEVMMDKDGIYQAFEILYWCGLRLGEMLALTPEDFNFAKKTVRVNKSLQRLEGEDVITDPKTIKSNRVVQMPSFVCEEMQDYINRLYGIKKNQRIFQITKSWLHHEMDRGSKIAGVKRIRIHDLRHSHVSLLIEIGINAVAIAQRVGHESVKITYDYAHMFPSKGIEIANKLEMEREVNLNVKEESGQPVAFS